MINKIDNSIPAETYFSAYDTSFVTGDSPATLDINAVLGKNGTKGHIANEGSNDLTIKFSNDGAVYGLAYLVSAGDILEFTELDIDSIEITWIANTAYKVFIV